MDKISTLNTLKNVFSALGAKTSDSNYAVGLFDKTSGEPKGLMGMSDLTSVLGGMRALGDLENYDCNDLPDNTVANVKNGTNKPGNTSNQVSVYTIGVGTFSFQIAYILNDNSGFFIRFKWGTWTSGTSTPWKKLTPTPLS